jgi:PAT family beta-lactamase induction signal transducer AmpG
MLALGFSAGLPLLLVLGTLSFRLREAGVHLTTIGFLSWIGLVYGFKWLWAPLVDRMPIPLLSSALGRRRSWLLFAQCTVAFGLVGMGLTNPQTHLDLLVWFALLVAFGSATQDIALDAFRIESAQTQFQAALAASYQTGYRLAMIWAGAGALWLASINASEISSTALSATAQNYDQSAWSLAYLLMAATMSVGVVTTLFSTEPAPIALEPSVGLKAWLISTLIEPFTDFWLRYRWQAVGILALIATYRISDIVMGIMANPFYVDMGYSKTEIATVTKIYGVLMTLLGAFIGGSLSVRYGVMRVLLWGAALSAMSNLLFSWLSLHGHDVHALIGVISADNLSSGIASSAFIAYLSSLTNLRYSATQYAMLSSVMLLMPKFLAGFSGVYVVHFGYSSFFIATALLGLPVIMLIIWVSRQAPCPAD